jgi:hypothetical protein
MINYPPKPWYDGQTFIHESSSGNKSKGTYYADKQGWSFSPLNEDGQTGDGEITTLTVKTINQRPTVTRDPFDIDSSNFLPTNQNDVNWYLHDLIVDNNQIITSINAGSVLQGPEELPFFSKEETRRNRPHIIPGSQQETNYTLLDKIESLEEKQQEDDADINDKVDGLSYTLETEPLSVRPQIQLVDQDQNFSNVHFDSSGGLDVYSTVDGIRYDGTQLVDANELQDQRLDRIESELNAFIRQKESGTWGYRADQTASSTLEAEYHLVTNLTQAEYDDAIDSCTNSYQQCLVDSAGDPTAASECNRIQVECRAAVPDVGTNSPVNGNFMIAKTLYINEKDAGDFTHSFGDTSVNDYIELIDEPGGNEYHLALISSKTYNSGTYTFEIVPVVSKGDLTFANGTEFHFFSLTQDADIETLDNRYLKLTGGDLTGNLHIRDGKKLYLHGTAGRIYLEDDDKKINTTLYTSGLIDSKGTIRSDKSSGVCLEARQDGTTTFKVYADGSSQTTKAITESTNNQAHVTKGWTDGRFAKGGGIEFEVSGNTLYVKF